MKTVWLFNHYAQEPNGPGGTRHYSLARRLRVLGWRMIIVASSVEHGTNRQRLPEGKPWQLESYNDVDFLWLRGNNYVGNGANRIRNMLEYTFAATKISPKVLPRPDVVIGSSVHPFAARAGAHLAKRFNAPFIFEIRDLWPQTLIDLGRLTPRHPMCIALRWLEKDLCECASRIITLLPDAYKYLETIGVPERRVVWIPNGVEIGSGDLPNRQAHASAEQPFTLMYFGAHGLANGLDNILRAMQLLQQKPDAPKVKLRLIGDGPEKPRLRQLAHDLHLAPEIFEPPIRKADIPTLASEADAFIFNLVDAPVFKYGISSNKLFDYMAAQRPIIFCCKSSNNPVAESGGGMTVSPENPQLLADAIERMALQTPEARNEMGLAARRHVQAQYSFDKLGDTLAMVLNECLTSPR
jgi:glycosyltransferase involved in cell wall biosynthesis